MATTVTVATIIIINMYVYIHEIAYSSKDGLVRSREHNVDGVLICECDYDCDCEFMCMRVTFNG